MDLYIVLALTVGIIFVLAKEKLPVDMAAVFVAVVLIVTRVLTPEQGLSGLGHPATVTVAAMFVLSAGLAKSGALGVASTLLTRLGRHSGFLAILTMMIVVAFASAFINNTAVVAIFLPIALEVSRVTKMSPSRLLMPLSFASMFGGVCTLVGSSTNILVSAIAASNGLRPFQMFEFSQLGLILAVAGVVYMLFIGIRLIPERRVEGDLSRLFEISDYLTDVVLLPEAKSVGKPAQDSALAKDLTVELIAVFRDGQRIGMPLDKIILAAGDVVRLRGDSSQIAKLQTRHGVSLVSHLGWREKDAEAGEMELVEAVIAPNSSLAGQTLKSSRFTDRFQAKVLAVRHHGQVSNTKLDSVPLSPGDTMLLAVRHERLEALARNPAFVVVSLKGSAPLQKGRALLAFAILGAVIAASAFNVVPTVVAALAGCAAMVLTGCLKPADVYPAVDWKVIVMLGGLLPLGFALETTGAATILSQGMVSVFGPLGPWALLGALYFTTSVLTEIMSNAATAVLLAPIAISSATAMAIDPMPLLMAVTFAASASFMTPVGYQTNTLIYGPGAYRFGDFLRVGTPLNLLYWIMATALIPRFWPF